MLNYNDVIKELYKVNNDLLDKNKIDEAFALTTLLWRVDNLSDPDISVVNKLNNILNNYK